MNINPDTELNPVIRTKKQENLKKKTHTHRKRYKMIKFVLFVLYVNKTHIFYLKPVKISTLNIIMLLFNKKAVQIKSLTCTKTALERILLGGGSCLLSNLLLSFPF